MHMQRIGYYKSADGLTDCKENCESPDSIEMNLVGTLRLLSGLKLVGQQAEFTWHISTRFINQDELINISGTEQVAVGWTFALAGQLPRQ